MADTVEQTLAALKAHWDERSSRYTDGPNKRLTFQTATQLHAHMQLQDAVSVLEVSAGPGLGALDIARRMIQRHKATTTTKTLTVTDYSPAMVELARENLTSGVREITGAQHLQVQCIEANGQDLAAIATASMDRYIATLGLQLVPDPDAMICEARRVLTPDGFAGFVIWGRPEFSGAFTIFSAANAELGLDGSEKHPYFALGKDIKELKNKFARAGFSQLRLWPFLAPIECWSGKKLAEYMDIARPVQDEDVRVKRFQVVQRMGDEWLEINGMPLGLEVCLVLAKP